MSSLGPLGSPSLLTCHDIGWPAQLVVAAPDDSIKRPRSGGVHAALPDGGTSIV
jgi:hypothetical protein